MFDFNKIYSVITMQANFDKHFFSTEHHLPMSIVLAMKKFHLHIQNEGILRFLLTSCCFCMFDFNKIYSVITMQANFDKHFFSTEHHLPMSIVLAMKKFHLHIQNEGILRFLLTSCCFCMFDFNKIYSVITMQANFDKHFFSTEHHLPMSIVLAMKKFHLHIQNEGILRFLLTSCCFCMFDFNKIYSVITMQANFDKHFFSTEHHLPMSIVLAMKKFHLHIQNEGILRFLLTSCCFCMFDFNKIYSVITMQDNFDKHFFSTEHHLPMSIVLAMKKFHLHIQNEGILRFLLTSCCFCMFDFNKIYSVITMQANFDKHFFSTEHHLPMSIVLAMKKFHLHIQNEGILRFLLTSCCFCMFDFNKIYSVITMQANFDKHFFSTEHHLPMSIVLAMKKFHLHIQNEGILRFLLTSCCFCMFDFNKIYSVITMQANFDKHFFSTEHHLPMSIVLAMKKFHLHIQNEGILRFLLTSCCFCMFDFNKIYSVITMQDNFDKHFFSTEHHLPMSIVLAMKKFHLHIQNEGILRFLLTSCCFCMFDFNKIYSVITMQANFDKHFFSTEHHLPMSIVLAMKKFHLHIQNEGILRFLLTSCCFCMFDFNKIYSVITMQANFDKHFFSTEHHLPMSIVLAMKKFHLHIQNEGILRFLLTSCCFCMFDFNKIYSVITMQANFDKHFFQQSIIFPCQPF